MPTLPSGRNVAINFQGLNEAIQRAFREGDESMLQRLDHPAEMFRLIEVADVEFREDIPCAELDMFWTEKGDQFGILHPLGYFISDVIRHRAGWSEVDISAFKRFLLRHSIKEIFRFRRREIATLRKLLKTPSRQGQQASLLAPAECEHAQPSWHL